MIHVDHTWRLLLPATLMPGVAVSAEQLRPVISPLATLGKLALALMLVLVVFWVFARVMKQLQGGQSGMHEGLTCIASLSLGQRERVVVVQAGEQQLVLGVTASQVNTLHVLEHSLSTRTTEEPGDFRHKLSAALKRQVTG